jgi:peptidyl-dipeptidase Dcp
VQGWDWRYYSEKVMKEKYELNDEMLRPYFSIDNVIGGIFYVAEKLYGITFKEVTNLPKYHEDVRTYEVYDKDGSLLSLFYADYYARPGAKRSGAWCGRIRSLSYDDKGVKTIPIVTNVCNFPAPTGDKPSLLNADEVETAFHEFGHALHGFFTDTRYSGISGVARDFVELPSQINEHWAFQPEVLAVYAKHYETGKVIPTELVEKIEASSKFGQGFKTVEYTAASILDMDYHVLNNVPEKLDVLKFETESMRKIGLLKQIPPRYRSTYFGHTMGGGYTAGYYSYLWSEVLDADAFDAFLETGDIFDQATAKKFRDEVLSRGGSDDEMVMYINFRGSEPNIDPLLKNRGLK